jgi:hypothetical protein
VIIRLLRWLLFWLWQRPLARLRRETIVVDRRRGRDDSPGTEDEPLRTLAELERRTSGRVLRGDLLVELRGDFDEVLHFHSDTDNGAQVITFAGGDREQRRSHSRRVRAFFERLNAGEAGSKDYPEPPASLQSFHVVSKNARVVFTSMKIRSSSLGGPATHRNLKIKKD